jgi:hypothetical protein
MSTFRSRQATRQASDPSKTRDSRGACLSFMRPINPCFTHNTLIMNHLVLCPEKVGISAFMRPCVANSRSPKPTPRLSHNPHPTTSNDAGLPFLRHFQPFFTANPLIMSSLPLCVNNRALCVTDTLFLPPATYNLRLAIIEKPHFVSDR